LAPNGEGLLYDPAGEPRFANVVLRAIARQFQAVRGEAALQASALPPLTGLFDPQAPLPEPVVREGEHGSTAVTFGDRLHLKIFRHVHEGTHPGVEVGRYLQERTEFRNVPPLAGYVDYRSRQDGPRTLVVLEGHVVNQGDAWHYFRGLLGRYYEQSLTRPDAGRTLTLTHRPLAELAEAPLQPEAADLLGAFLEPVRMLARRTAEFHLALASAVDEPDFAPEPFTALLQRSLYQSVRSQVLRALEVLRRRQKGLPAEVQDLARQVLAREGELVVLARRIADHKLTAVRTRYHGDLHLGRVLYTGKDFVIVDLEGNAHRPMSDRRRKRSPLRDVASLLRSFHYATLAALRSGGIRREDIPPLEPWRHFWLLWMSVVFVQEYCAVASGAAFLPQSQAELDTLLTFYALKRTGLELRDDVLHRPDRVQVPLEGLLHFLDTHT
jgi:maltose alpha-D-glucosyltransferase/alpha-amylase